MQASVRSEAVVGHNRQRDVQLALWLTYITIGWMSVEGAAALLLGWASKSLLLEAFGIDSLIELFSGGVLLWRLKVEANGTSSSERLEAVERRAAKWVGYSLYLLVVYVLLNSGYGLFIAKRVTDTHESAWGILIGIAAKVGMPLILYPARIGAPKFASTPRRRRRVNRLRLSLDRIDSRSGRNSGFGLVVARQCGRARADSLHRQGSARGDSRGL